MPTAEEILNEIRDDAQALHDKVSVALMLPTTDEVKSSLETQLSSAQSALEAEQTTSSTLRSERDSARTELTAAKQMLTQANAKFKEGDSLIPD